MTFGTYTCEPIKIESEFRVYVNDGEIMGVKHYYGDWSIVPYKDYLKFPIEAYKPCPIAYGIDIAMVERKEDSWMDTPNYKEIVLEVNDGCNLGNYGLDSIFYGEMIVARWMEIVKEKLQGTINNPLLSTFQKIVMSNPFEGYEKI